MAVWLGVALFGVASDREHTSGDEVMAPYMLATGLTQADIDDARRRGVRWVAFPSLTALAMVHQTASGPVLAGRVLLKPDDLLAGYGLGCFPYPNQSLPGVPRESTVEYFWHRPDPRTVFLPERHKPLPKILRRALRKYPITVNGDFQATVTACADAARTQQQAAGHVSKPWITNALIDAYVELYGNGNAFSIEACNPDGTPAGGLFGVTVGRFVTVESMYRVADDSSKAAFAALLVIARREGVPMVDVQLAAPHWISWGGMPLTDRAFRERVKGSVAQEQFSLSDYEGECRPIHEPTLPSLE